MYLHQTFRQLTSSSIQRIANRNDSTGQESILQADLSEVEVVGLLQVQLVLLLVGQ
jgi:hypothetical protein